SGLGLTWAAVVALVVIGSRDGIVDGFRPVGGFLPLPSDAFGWFASMWSAWDPRGIGATSPTPTGWGFLGVLDTALLFREGLALTAFVLGVVLLGILGASRLASVFPLSRARIAAIVVYAGAPVVARALGSGDLDALVLYAALPWTVELLRRIAGIAKARGQDVMEVMYDLLVDNDGKELFYQPLGGYQGFSLEGQKKLLEHPNVLFGLSDGGAHCGVIADAGMPTFIMTHWGRDRTRGDLMSLEFIVESLTSKTARAFGMFDRGEISEGKIADINIIDFGALQLHRPEAVFDLPAGGRRLVQRADGYDMTIKAGEVIFKSGEHTGALPGKLVRRSDEGQSLSAAG
ncbi:MAG: hypothetical protein EBY49_11265, partial [Actinobacteria bacterium]|nr:hypothetical protein [Actinomycetota bacterium]